MKETGVFGVLFAVSIWLLSGMNGAGMAGSSQDNASLRHSVVYNSSTPGYDITFVFDKDYACGQYANGDWWVAADPDTKKVVITQITPDGVKGRNGWCVNPVDQNKQPFDDRTPQPYMPYDPSLTPALPYSAHGGESILKSASAKDPYRGKILLQYAAVLTVVSAPVANSATLFRPPYAGTFRPVFKVADLQTQLLPSLAPVKYAATQAEVEKLTRNLRIDHASNCFYAEALMPIDATSDWGSEIAMYDASVFLWLCLNQPLEAKMKTLIGIVQYGIDLYGARKSLNTQYYVGGGNNEGRLLPLIFAGTLLNSKEIKDDAMRLEGNGNSWWECGMFSRSKSDPKIVLWGYTSGYMKEEGYWCSLAAAPELNKDEADPYGVVDGGSIPGDYYQACCSMPVKYMALMLHLIPQLKASWPEKDIKILDYADRYVTVGTQTLPDPYAPAPKLTWNQWLKKEEHGYGKTWGPDPAHPGQAIKGSGRFPELHGKHADGAGCVAPRANGFGDEMWTAYRHLPAASAGEAKKP